MGELVELAKEIAEIARRDPTGYRPLSASEALALLVPLAADSVNPCTFAVYTALLMVVLVLGGLRRMLASALAFVSSVFACCYLLVPGVGASLGDAPAPGASLEARFVEAQRACQHRRGGGIGRAREEEHRGSPRLPLQCQSRLDFNPASACWTVQRGHLMGFQQRLTVKIGHSQLTSRPRYSPSLPGCSFRLRVFTAAPGEFHFARLTSWGHG